MTRIKREQLAPVLARINALMPGSDHSINYAYGQPRLVRKAESIDVSPRLTVTQLYEWMHAYIQGAEAYRDAPKPLPDGVTGTVTSSLVCIANNVGGTDKLPHGSYRVRLLSRGSRYSQGTLLDPNQVEQARKLGTKPYTPEHYRKNYGPEMGRDVERAARDFDPARVSFPADDFKMD